MATSDPPLPEDDTKSSNPENNLGNQNCDPIVIHPEGDPGSDSESDNGLEEFCDAVEPNDKCELRDELSDIKDKMCNRDKESLENGTKGDLLNEDDDFYEDAKDNNMHEDELNEDELRDVRNEELKIREEEENSLSEEVKQQRREDAKYMKESANKLYANSQHEEAIKGYTEALDRCPLCFKEDRAKFFSNRAQAKFRQDNKDGAIEDFSEAIDLDPNYLRAIRRRAQIYEDTDKPHEAMKDFQRILEIDPKDIESTVAVSSRLPEKIKEKDEKLKAEMFDNLKKLGNMCLNPFGLSTENFQFVQDPNTGGYSVNFKK